MSDLDLLRQYEPILRFTQGELFFPRAVDEYVRCLLYTSDAADERSSVDLGGRRIIKKKHKTSISG